MASIDPAAIPLADVLAQAALEWDAAEELDATLSRILASAVEAIPGVQHASFSLKEAGRVRTAASTDAFADGLDQRQYQSGQGPCLDAIDAEHRFRTGNLIDDPRWPDFAKAAADTGIASMMTFHLRRPHRPVLGALNLFSTEPDAFDDEAEHIGGLFAVHASIAVVRQIERTELTRALSSRDAIGTAKGIMMRQHDLTEEQAFTMLTRASQRSNRKLRDIAEWIIADANSQADQQHSRPTEYQGVGHRRGR